MYPVKCVVFFAMTLEPMARTRVETCHLATAHCFTPTSAPGPLTPPITGRCYRIQLISQSVWISFTLNILQVRGPSWPHVTILPGRRQLHEVQIWYTNNTSVSCQRSGAKPAHSVPSGCHPLVPSPGEFSMPKSTVL